MFYDFEKLKFHNRISLIYNDKAIGPGILRILELVKETGKLSEAYRIMGISSSKAWRIIKNAEEDLGTKLINTSSGGVGGGGSELTKEGEDFLNKYNSFTNEVDEIVKNLFDKHFGCDIIE